MQSAKSMSRREVLKSAGLLVVGAALGSVGTTALLPALKPQVKGDRHSYFVSFSKKTTGEDHRTAFVGAVRFNAGRREVEGGGTFIYFNNGATGTPKPFLSPGFGGWEAKEFVSYDHQVGTYGTIEASILEMKVNLLPSDGSVIPATLRLICNVGAANLSTGEPEGFKFTAPFGTFVPLDPVLGITHISIEGR